MRRAFFDTGLKFEVDGRGKFIGCLIHWRSEDMELKYITCNWNEM